MRLADTGETGRPGKHALHRRQFLQGIAATGLAAGTGGLLAACSSGSSPSPAPSPGHRAPRHGGDLKLGLTGGSTDDSIDPHMSLTYIDAARLQALYSPLVQLSGQAQPELVLAESIEPRNGSASEWVIRLKRGVTFHDGQELTAADVIFTFKRIINGHLSGATGLGPVDVANLKALDKYTVLVPMKRPFGSFFEQLAAFWFYQYIAPAGFKPSKPNGTGPFKFGSFTPGQRSVFTRNPHYLKPGLPYADTLTIIDFEDAVSLQNALISGIVQGAGTLSSDQVAALRSAGGVQVVVSKAGTILPFTMRVDRPPFNDVRVRQAMRFLVDRPQLISSALGGYATVASDVFSPYDPDFDGSLRREQDIGQAKFLLKKAAQPDLTVQLVTSAVTTGLVQMATVLAQQAKAAGVTINLKTVPSAVFFGPNYLQWAFAQDYYNYSPYLAQVAYSMLPASPFNETHTDNARYNQLYAEANQTTNSPVRKELLHQMQEYDFNNGGYIIPAFVSSLDAYSTKITGYYTSPVGQPLANYGFENFSFTQ